MFGEFKTITILMIVFSILIFVGMIVFAVVFAKKHGKNIANKVTEFVENAKKEEEQKNKCPYCGCELEESATSCPNCGAKRQRKTTKKSSLLNIVNDNDSSESEK